MDKGIDSAFDHMELCFVVKQKINLSENWLGLPRNYFISEFPSSNFLLPTFLTGGKWDFQVANLLLLISNSELDNLLVILLSKRIAE